MPRPNILLLFFFCFCFLVCAREEEASHAPSRFRDIHGLPARSTASVLAQGDACSPLAQSLDLPNASDSGSDTSASSSTCSLPVEVMYQFLSDMPIGALVVKTDNLRLLYSNNALCGYVGRTTEELKGTKLQDLLVLDERESNPLLTAIGSHSSSAARTRQKRFTIMKCVGDDGEGVNNVYEYNVSHTPGFACVYFTSFPVEDFKKAKLNESLVDSSPVGHVVIDHFGIVLSVNSTLAAMLHTTPPFLMGKNIKVVMPDDVARCHDGYLAVWRNLRKMTTQSTIINQRRQLQAKTIDGQLINVLLTVRESEDVLIASIISMNEYVPRVMYDRDLVSATIPGVLAMKYPDLLTGRQFEVELPRVPIVMFDRYDSTVFSQRNGSRQTFEAMNEHMKSIIPVGEGILQGSYFKCTGDGSMWLFDLLYNARYAPYYATLFALDTILRLEEENRSRAADQRFEVRASIAFDAVHFARFDGVRLKFFDALGPAPNLASRLCDRSIVGKQGVAVDRNTYNAINDSIIKGHFVRKDRPLKGFRDSVEFYTLELSGISEQEVGALQVHIMQVMSDIQAEYNSFLSRKRQLSFFK